MAEPLHFTEYDTRLAAYAVIVRDGAMLLSWFNGSSPCWSLPGGGVDFDEGIGQAIVRETYEETGYHIELGDFLAEHHFVVEASAEAELTGRTRPFKSQRFLFAATITGGELGTVERGGTTDFAQWVPLDQIGPGDTAAGKPAASIVTLAAMAIARRSRAGTVAR